MGGFLSPAKANLSLALREFVFSQLQSSLGIVGGGCRYMTVPLAKMRCTLTNGFGFHSHPIILGVNLQSTTNANLMCSSNYCHEMLNLSMKMVNIVHVS